MRKWSVHVHPIVAKLYIVARVDANKFADYLSDAIADVNRTK